MNAIADKAHARDLGSTPVVERRLYAGQGVPQSAPLDYTVLLPADGEWPRELVLRAIVADILHRNGKSSTRTPWTPPSIRPRRVRPAGNRIRPSEVPPASPS